MDLKALEVEDVCECNIVDRNGDKTDIVFQLAGPGHPIRVALDRKLAARSLRGFNRHGKVQIPEDPDDLFENETARLVSLTLGWSGVSNADGKDIEFTAEAARAIYENRRSSVRAQVSRALTDIGNFTPGSSPSS